MSALPIEPETWTGVIQQALPEAPEPVVVHTKTCEHCGRQTRVMA